MAAQLAPRRKRKERRHILFRVERVVIESTGEVVGALVPRFATDRRLMRDRGYRMGDDLRAELSKPRHLGQHRKAHLLGGLVVTQLEGFEGLDQHAAIKRLQREAGVCCEVEQIDAAPVVTAILAAAETMLGEVATRMLRRRAGNAQHAFRESWGEEPGEWRCDSRLVAQSRNYRTRIPGASRGDARAGCIEHVHVRPLSWRCGRNPSRNEHSVHACDPASLEEARGPSRHRQRCSA